MSKCESFLPSINNESKILVLGSMPGIKSLEMQQYYAHPQNRFWKVMGSLCEFEGLSDCNYNKKLKILLDNHYALWDVLKYCERDGSLDSNIEKEIPNDIHELLSKYPNIQKIVLNGSKSYSALKKYFPEIIQQYECCKMPSTSPANANYSLYNLCKIWMTIKYKKS